jgi:hypothetical protein
MTTEPNNNIPAVKQGKARTRKAVTVTPAPDNGPEKPIAFGPGYTLESTNVFIELQRIAENAQAEIVSIDNDILSIQDRAERDISTIASRRDAEIAGRRQRIDDLNRSISLVSNGLNSTNETPQQ